MLFIPYLAQSGSVEFDTAQESTKALSGALSFLNSLQHIGGPSCETCSDFLISIFLSRVWGIAGSSHIRRLAELWILAFGYWQSAFKNQPLYHIPFSSAFQDPLPTVLRLLDRSSRELQSHRYSSQPPHLLPTALLAHPCRYFWYPCHGLAFQSPASPSWPP